MVKDVIEGKECDGGVQRRGDPLGVRWKIGYRCWESNGEGLEACESPQLTDKVSVRFGEPLDHLSHSEVLEDQVKEVVHKPRCWWSPVVGTQVALPGNETSLHGKERICVHPTNRCCVQRHIQRMLLASTDD